MRILLYGKRAEDIRPQIEKLKIGLVEEHPEVILVYGGDGAMMKAEYDFPGVPKVLLKGSAICKRCLPLPNEEILKRVKNGDFEIEEAAALEVEADGYRSRGINDIIVHNKDHSRAIRYNLAINGKDMGHEVIGDGIVVATPYGSTGYYRSITHSFFETGIGLAFNNSTEPFNHMVLDDNVVIEARITRGPAVVFADNQKDFKELDDGGVAIIKKSKNKARFLKFR
ncbi:MAG TPA: hypothetical protein VNK70_00930 [Candidatus Paceibacterota bacterium]|nr:hypothetical protein [Candidatus Paceibacterota bacterium]